jgi:hypothetical protein
MKKLGVLTLARRRNLPKNMKYAANSAFKAHVEVINVNEKPQSSEKMQEVQRLADNIVAWTRKELGIDISSRTFNPRKIHFYDREDWKEVCKVHGMNGEQLAITNSANNIFILDEPPEEILTSVINHELVHASAYHTVFVEPISPHEQDISTNGTSGFTYTRRRTLSFFNEIVTDAIGIELLQSVNKATETLHHTNYKNGIILFDLMMQDLALRNNMTPKHMWKEFYSAYFTGDFTVFRKISNAYGKDKMKEIADLKKGSYLDSEILSLALKLGLDIPTLLTQLEKLNKGEEVRLSNGTRFKVFREETKAAPSIPSQSELYESP